MDLLDLTLDLESQSPEGPTTRSTRAARMPAPASATNKTATSKPASAPKTPSAVPNATPRTPGTSRVATPKTASTKKAVTSTPKPTASAPAASKSSTSRTAPTPKSATTASSAHKSATPVDFESTPNDAGATMKKPAMAKPRTSIPKITAPTPAPQSASQKSVSTPKVTQLRDESSISPSDSRGSSAERTSRSDSMEKRSRNKAKKRFSPSPEIPSKKRKSMAVATAPRPASPEASVHLTDAVFEEHVGLLEDVLKKQGPVDFELPTDLDNSDDEDDETETRHDTDAVDDNSSAATSSQTTSSSTPITKKIEKDAVKIEKSALRNPSEAVATNEPEPDKNMDPAAKPSRRAVGGADGEGTSQQNTRCRTYSRELGVDDVVPDTEQAPSFSEAAKTSLDASKKAKKEEPTPTRRSQRKSTTLHEDVHHEAKQAAELAPEPQGRPKRDKKKVRDDEGEAPKPQRVSRRRDSAAMPAASQADATVTPKKIGKKKLVEELKQETVEEHDQPSTSDPPARTPKPNPNSAMAIRQKLMETQEVSKPVKKPRKSLATSAKKVVIVEREKEPKQEIPEVEDATEETVKTEEPQSSDAAPSSAQTTTPTAALPTFKTPSSSARSATRTSGRVSKPNRLYVDRDYNTEVLGRDRITEQNTVIEAQAKEPTPEPITPTIPILNAPPKPQIKKKPVAREYVPKPIPLLNGVQRGYIASVKIPLADIEVDGVVEKLNEVVTSLMDTILLKVCDDGVELHENIDPKVVRAKAKIKADVTKRARIEAKKLDIQMCIKTPSTSDDLGKRKRHAPRADDYYWIPPAHKSKLARESKEEREDTPLEDEELPVGEKVQQKARESISHMFDAEMDATMAEAKTFSVSFEKYMKPKLAHAQQQVGVKLMSRKRQTSISDDFFYHELLIDQPSPTKSNIENEDVDVDVEEVDESAEAVTRESVISLRTDALDIAEQIAVFIPRPTQMDGSPITAEHLDARVIELPESRQIAYRNTMRIVLEQLSHESAPVIGNAEVQGCNWHTATTVNAQLLKNLYIQYSTERNDLATWTHEFMVENLPIHVLASYLNLLRYARRLYQFEDPNRFASIISSTDQLDGDWPQATNLLKSFVYRRYAEPGTETIDSTIPYYRMMNTVFLLVSPTMTCGGANSQARLPGRLFHWLKSIGHPDSEMIGFNDDSDQSCSVAEYVSDVLVDTICEKVKQKRRETKDCAVVLVGYGAATYLVHRAVNLVAGVQCVVSIGFPVMTKYGRRGTADDEILLTYCPTLFIVGADGQRFDNKAITALRSSMLSSTGLVVVAHASDSLMVPPSFLLRLGISQTVVFRIILEKILDFLNMEPFRQKNQDLSELVPIELNNIYVLDSSMLKSEKALSGLAFASSSTPPIASPLGAAGRRATVAGGEEVPKKKRAEPSTSQQQQFYSGHGAPPLPSPRADERFLAFQNLVVSTVATADDMPRRASMGSSPRVVERGDFRDRAAAIAAAASASRAPPPPPPASIARGPIDPASISLS